MSERNVQLTGETVVPASGRHVAVVLLCAVLSVVASNLGALAFVRSVPLNRSYWLIHEKWSRLEALREPAEWLMLGDSSCNQGIRTDVWEQQTGERALNLCTIGDMLATEDAWMLDRHIRAHGAPRRGVVVVHVYDVWHRRASSALRGTLLANIPMEWGFWKNMSPRLPLSSGDEASLFAAKYVPLYSQNATLAKVIGRGFSFDRPNFFLEPSGYMPWHQANAGAVRNDARHHLQFVSRARFKPSGENRAAIKRIRALAEEHRFHVYFAPSPIVDSLPRSDAWQKYKLAIDAWQRKAFAGSNFVHLIEEGPTAFPASEMENADHLTHEAAGRYTTGLAKRVLEKRDAAGASTHEGTRPANGEE